MKLYLLFFAFLFTSIFTAHSQITEINGVSKKKKPLTIKLFKIISGQLEEIAFVNSKFNASFKFKFKPDYKGYYVLGFGDSQDPKNKFKLYVKGNDRINLELNDSTYLLRGINTRENEVLSLWHKLAFNIERRSVYFIPSHLNGFFPQLENLASKVKNWASGKETNNAEFDELMKTTVEYDLAYFALAFISSSRASQPNVADYNPYLKNFKADQFLQNARLYNFPYGTIMLKNLVSFKNRNLREPNLEMAVMSIGNDTLKGEYVLSEASILKSYTSYQDMIGSYEKYFLTEDQKTRKKKYELKLAKFRPGAEAINFTYPDRSGTMISLGDFKGKIVLVDVWATWCGPCIAEIPFLKKLEEEFHDKNVVFLSVSTDVEKDKEKWKKFISDKRLGGIQLFANGGSSTISKVYHISGIPRFMLFDKNGHIIDVDSPRPSDPKLREILNEYLDR
ncbi:TlpA family protein disulfide reductase [Pedobacter insulae]|uniref:Thiol-disulfide isomerase or thioredoxin n=1 Tax=Pedobacter insulae TaxID=414048 RepID=A0A1I2TSR0_9SPHI|nr:TlpA disulfide reductase family protein [Pedobacter insulae]SFG67898.1 Thiol-disulfide isomerase or thioredoxin [Pedobacter insulae]